MRKAVLLLIILSIPAFAQDDEMYPRRPEKLNEQQQRRSVPHKPHGAGTPILPRCVYSKTCKSGAEVEAEMRRESTTARSRWEGRPDMVDISVLGGMALVVIYWISRERQARKS